MTKSHRSEPEPESERFTVGDYREAKRQASRPEWRGYQSQTELGLLAWLAGSPGLEALTIPAPPVPLSQGMASFEAELERLALVARGTGPAAMVAAAVNVRGWPPALSGDDLEFFHLARRASLSLPEDDPILEMDWPTAIPLLATKQLAAVIGEVVAHHSGGRARWVWALLHWYARRDPGPQHFAIARAALAVDGFEDTNGAVDRLARAFVDGVKGLQTALGLTGNAPPDDSPEGAWLDKVGSFFEASGECGRTYGTGFATVEEASPGGRWRQWFGADVLDGWPTTSRVLRALVRALWADVVGPALERDAARDAAEREAAPHRRPVVARCVMVGELIPAMAGEFQRPLPGLESRALTDHKGRTVAQIDGDVALALRGLERLGTPVGHRLLDTLVIRAWEQYEASSQDPGVVVFEGGLAGLAAAIGHNNDTAALRALVEVGPSVQWTRPGAHGGGLWLWSATRGGPGKPGQLRFTLGDPLRPGFLVALEQADKAHTPASRAAYRGIPILRRSLPVGSLNERSHGAVYLMGRLLLVELVDGAELLHLNEGIRLDDKRWSEMAKRAGLPSGSLSKLRDAWLSGDDSSKAPPLIKEVGGGLVTLGDAHELERLFIEERGRRAIEGRRVARLRKKGAKSKT